MLNKIYEKIKNFILENYKFMIVLILLVFAFTYELFSAQVYKIVKPKELRGLFLPYHTLDPAQAVERILEAKGMILDENRELERQYAIFKKVRRQTTKRGRAH